jgi:hypothetical protein
MPVPTCFSALAFSLSSNRSSASQSPPATRCFESLSDPATSDVPNHFDGLSSNDTYNLIETRSGWARLNEVGSGVQYMVISKTKGMGDTVLSGAVINPPS